MADWEKVIKGLAWCSEGNKCSSECPYWKYNGSCIYAMQKDALKLLQTMEDDGK